MISKIETEEDYLQAQKELKFLFQNGSCTYDLSAADLLYKAIEEYEQKNEKELKKRL